jgi:hypothetical protein
MLAGSGSQAFFASLDHLIGKLLVRANVVPPGAWDGINFTCGSLAQSAASVRAV